ncbi:DUF2062 domain-containing protein [Prochlorococcus marinus]|uniref:DUF2062 domain-containing protein n=1 Tax=Prochlorococcus marinus TaxID=1219 RepID=UPI0022B509EC|nr:DUF2062 domain-containing protein [Prochlorococcus marinus]
MIDVFFRLIKKVRNVVRWFWEEHGTPAYRARGVGVGVFSGCFPLFGFQSLIGIFLASLFRGNHFLAITGTWISNPFTYIPLYWFNYKVGKFFLGEVNNLSSLGELTQYRLWTQGWIISSRILLGSTIVGLLFGLLFGCISYQFFKAKSRLYK